MPCADANGLLPGRGVPPGRGAPGVAEPDAPESAAAGAADVAEPGVAAGAAGAAEAAGAPADLHPRSRAIAPLPPWRDAYVAAWPAFRDRLQSARNHAGEDGL